jgi:hypothetical protein
MTGRFIMFLVFKTSVASLRKEGGNLAPEYMATIIPEWVATIRLECMAMLAGIRSQARNFACIQSFFTFAEFL